MPVANCYFLYSKKVRKHYIGSTQITVEERLLQHNTVFYPDGWSKRGIPWTIFLIIPCQSITQARAIESHIKSMKSTVYIHNLIKYPEIIQKLKNKYPL